jgi:N-acetylglucosaminyldiphosphoundecaprenol N-acetyl-beta-D-mannosaminyltransferase
MRDTAVGPTLVIKDRVHLGGVDLDPLDEQQVVDWVVSSLHAGRGGWIATPNVDHLQKCSRDPELRALLCDADLRVPDGAPVVWASHLCGHPLPARVTGADLLWSLTRAAARNGFSVYLLGGEPGVPEAAARLLQEWQPRLVVAGTYSPPLGFEHDPAEMARVERNVVSARPDVVFVGLGFPKQEQLIVALHDKLPRAWWLGCGAAIPFAAGAARRAPNWMGRLGLEWLFRMAHEPRRLVRRYLREDAPYAVALLLRAACSGVVERLPWERLAQWVRVLPSDVSHRVAALRPTHESRRGQ